ncbi:MAG: MaoC/PaaZ C-terminal domain-containing protein [Pseudomonadales bacterium]
MPLNTANIGRATDYFAHDVDARWLMAYAASLNDLNPEYMDTTAGCVRAHPLFPVCLEWPTILATRALLGEDLSDDESARGVHAAHDLHIYKPIRSNSTLRTRATLVSVDSIKPGAGYTLRLDTIDETEDLVCQTFQFGIYRGVAVTGTETTTITAPELPAPQPLNKASTDIPVAAGTAHTYTECARIWNPIHTDRQFAQNAGLPDIILHGTATMALAVSQLVEQFTQGQPHRVTRIGGRFAAMVFMPSTLKLQTSNISAQPDGSQLVSYNVITAENTSAISHGFFVYK